jgi:hypothetical protein
MKKHRIENIRKVSGASQSEITPEQIKQSREMFVNLLTPVIEKMLKSPGDIKPVSDSFESLARQAKEGVFRQSTIIQTGGGSSEVPKKSTLIISGGSLEVPKKSTDIDIEVPQKFTDFEMELLRQIQNGEQ